MNFRYKIRSMVNRAAHRLNRLLNVTYSIPIVYRETRGERDLCFDRDVPSSASCAPLPSHFLAMISFCKVTFFGNARE